METIPEFCALLGDAFHKVDRTVLRRYAAALRPYQLGVYEAVALMHIIELSKAEGVNQRTIIAHIGVTNPAMVRMVKKMERMGLITRREDPGDKRSRVLFPTKLGIERGLACRDVMLETDSICFSRLTEEEKQLLKRIVRKL